MWCRGRTNGEGQVRHVRYCVLPIKRMEGCAAWSGAKRAHGAAWGRASSGESLGLWLWLSWKSPTVPPDHLDVT
jgi:hypothetical protein